MINNPYVGPRPFDEEHSSWFFGRQAEVIELISLVKTYQVVVLYSQSGAGKSSLLSAGLFPALRQEGSVLLRPTRVKVSYINGSGATTNPYVLAALHGWLKPGEEKFRNLTHISLKNCLLGCRQEIPATKNDAVSTQRCEEESKQKEGLSGDFRAREQRERAKKPRYRLLVAAF